MMDQYNTALLYSPKIATIIANMTYMCITQEHSGTICCPRHFARGLLQFKKIKVNCPYEKF